MKLTAEKLRAGYEFLRVVAFKEDSRLPQGRYVRFVAGRLTHHGYYDYVRGRHTIWVNAKGTSWALALHILAHEMIHLARRDNDKDECDQHDAEFKAEARQVERGMGWPRGSV